MVINVAVLTETRAHERRVALVPSTTMALCDNAQNSS